MEPSSGGIAGVAEEEQIVDPWEVSAKDGVKIDYDKLIVKFGCQRLNPSIVTRIKRLTGLPTHIFLCCSVIFVVHLHSINFAKHLDEVLEEADTEDLEHLLRLLLFMSYLLAMCGVLFFMWCARVGCDGWKGYGRWGCDEGEGDVGARQYWYWFDSCSVTLSKLCWGVLEIHGALIEFLLVEVW